MNAFNIVLIFNLNSLDSETEEMISLSIFACVLVVFWYKTKYYYRNQLLNKIPAIKSYPIIGSNLLFFGRSAREIFISLQKARDEIGSVFRYDLSPFHSSVIVSYHFHFEIFHLFSQLFCDVVIL